MAAYMIFAEGETQTSGLTERLGIAEIEIGEPRLTWLRCEVGPGGKPGLLGFWMDPDHVGAQAFDPSAQRWVLVPSERFWVGTHLSSPLKPKDIQRINTHNSIEVRLEDGNKWKVPKAGYLPSYHGEDATGAFRRQPRDEFSEFCHQAEAIFQHFVDQMLARRLDPEAEQKNLPIKVQGQWEYVCHALSLNYRLARPIISALQLIGDESGALLLLATVEMDLAADVENEKKNSA